MPTISSSQRFRKNRPCPVCNGSEDASRGQGSRCYGYLSSDGAYAHCTRDEHAGALTKNPDSDTYAHKLIGDCRCGVRHDPTPEDRSSHNGHQGKHITATYDYVDEQGTLLYQTVRLIPKGFYQRRPDGPEGWINSLKGVRPVIYHLPEVLEAIAAEKTICIPEGEEDSKALQARGYTATCNHGGAGKWFDHHSRFLVGAVDVVLFGDNDGPGRAHIEKQVQSLKTVGIVPRIAQMDGLSEHGDIRDWLKAHPTQEDLDRLIQEAIPLNSSNSFNSYSYLKETPWPELDERALIGLAGEFVRLVGPHTEADLVALLVEFLLAFGNVIDRKPHCEAEADYHAFNENAVLVGNTAKGRKGSSWGHVYRLFERIDEAWASDRISSGLSSGEGLIVAVGDGEDKRLLVMEAEFSSTLRVLNRDGNTLSAVLRNAWDGTALRTLTKHSPLKAAGAHISIIGHITKDELLRHLTETEAGNGFGNRFLWVCVRRSKELPEGGALERSDFNSLVVRLQKAITWARQQALITRDEEARQRWHAIYHALSAEKPGLLGHMIARAEAHVLRLSGIYALLDQSTVIKRPHLEAALALWNYCEASCRYIFGDALGDPVADEIMRLLLSTAEGMTRTEISNHFGRNKSADQLSRALGKLMELRLIYRSEEETSGRTAERWFARQGTNTN